MAKSSFGIKDNPVSKIDQMLNKSLEGEFLLKIRFAIEELIDNSVNT